MKKQHQLTIAAIALLWACTATAQAVYKSVDERGRVVYSATPPPEGMEDLAQEVVIEPGPTEAELQEALQRAKEVDEYAQRLEQEREEPAAEAGKEPATENKEAPTEAGY